MRKMDYRCSSGQSHPMRRLLLILLPDGNARSVRCRLSVDLINPAKDGRPVAVRCGWANNPDGNLINGAGLPARSFRSNDCLVVTRAKK